MEVRHSGANLFATVRAGDRECRSKILVAFGPARTVRSPMRARADAKVVTGR
jgi:hypothetical protein